MIVLVFRCPTTGKEVLTGIETDKESFAKIESFPGSIRCRVCGERHPWAGLRVWLAENTTAPNRFQKPGGQSG